MSATSSARSTRVPEPSVEDAIADLYRKHAPTYPESDGWTTVAKMQEKFGTKRDSTKERLAELVSLGVLEHKKVRMDGTIKSIYRIKGEFRP
jgi:hypothetical protein